MTSTIEPFLSLWLERERWKPCRVWFMESTSAWPFDPIFLHVSTDGGETAKSYLVTTLTLTLKALIPDTILLEDSASTCKSWWNINILTKMFLCSWDFCFYAGLRIYIQV